MKLRPEKNIIMAGLFACCLVFAQAQENNKNNTEHGCPLEQLLLKHLERTTHPDIERASKKINLKFGTGSWSAKETRTEIRRLLRQHLPNADEGTLVTAEAVLLVKAACAFTNDSGSTFETKRGDAQAEVRKAMAEMERQQAEEHAKAKADNVKNVLDLIRQLIQIDSQAKQTQINVVR